VWIASPGAGAPPRKLTNVNPQVASWRLGDVTEVTWKNKKDGQALDGILILPAGYQAGHRYPTVVLGYPGDFGWRRGFYASHVEWGQLLASHGYAVFLPNYRGALGHGVDFDNQRWGGVAFDDLMDGVDSIVASGVADPDRLGIGGWSNGGFYAAWAVTHTTRFRAAAGFVVNPDMAATCGAQALYGLFRVSLSRSPFADRAYYDARSPIAFITRARTPMLILHDQDDQGTSIDEPLQMYNGLKAQGVDAELVVYPREGWEWLSERPHQIDLMRRVLAWFDRYLKA
jgi:dipeptidyl aminopeptidase/acylaminoacyl peptidase